MMGLDPKNSTVKRIYEHWESKSENRRPYLGASAIGTECERKLWLGFRWCFTTKFDGRMLRLFNRGHREEPVFEEEMRAIGCQLEGTQHEEVAHDGHFKMHCDGAILGLVEAPKTWHVADFKTMSDKSFKKFEKCKTDDDFAEEYPTYHGQLHVEMEMMGLTRAALIAVNKNTDHLHMLRLKENGAGAYYLEKAGRIIHATAPEAHDRNPTDYRCRFCDSHSVCHGIEAPEINCRNCCYATPVADGKWACADRDGELLTDDTSKHGCKFHLWVPGILPWELKDYGSGWVEYTNGVVNSGDPDAVPENVIRDCAVVGTSHDIKRNFEHVQNNKIIEWTSAFPPPEDEPEEFTASEAEEDPRKQMLLDLIESGDENAKSDYHKEYVHANGH